MCVCTNNGTVCGGPPTRALVGLDKEDIECDMGGCCVTYHDSRIAQQICTGLDWRQLDLVLFSKALVRLEQWDKTR
jgi:hypothetical protein